MREDIIQEKSTICEDVTVIRRNRSSETRLKKKKVAAYCRVSTDMDAQATSIETQMESYKIIISEHPDWELAGIYADQGITGTKANRPQFQKMLSDARNGKIDMIIAKSASRFSRNTVDLLTIIRDLKDRGIGVYFEKENLNTLSLQSEMLLTVYAAFAQEESHSVSENMKRGIRQRFQIGIPKWAEIYGLKRVGKDEWGIDKEQGPVVQEIFDCYLRGMSQREIADYLNKKGIAGPNRRDKNPKWFQYGVAEIIRNEKYAGDCLMQKYYTKDFISHKRIKNSDTLVNQYYKENHHPAIVPREVYEDANRIMLMRDTKRGCNQYPYYGRLICPYCGAKMVRTYIPTWVTKKGWICGGEGEETLYTKRTKCQPYWVKEPYLGKSIRGAILSYKIRRLDEEDVEALQEVRKELKTRTTIEFNDLRKTIKSITFPDWDTMEITWNWGEKTCVPYQVDRAVDYPDPRDEDGWRKATPGATNFIQVEDAVEKLIQMVKQVRIIPDTSKRFEVPPMVYRDEAEMLRRMNGEKK